VPLNERITNWTADDETATLRRDHGDLLLAFHGIVERDQVSGPGSGGNRPEAPRQLGRLRANLRADAPDGALLAFLRCWILLYGAVSMEVLATSNSRWTIRPPCSTLRSAPSPNQLA
jgi:hypothetical protein